MEKRRTAGGAESPVSRAAAARNDVQRARASKKNADAVDGENSGGISGGVGERVRGASVGRVEGSREFSSAGYGGNEESADIDIEDDFFADDEFEILRALRRGEKTPEIESGRGSVDDVSSDDGGGSGDDGGADDSDFDADIENIFGDGEGDSVAGGLSSSGGSSGPVDDAPEGHIKILNDDGSYEFVPVGGVSSGSSASSASSAESASGAVVNGDDPFEEIDPEDYFGSDDDDMFSESSVSGEGVFSSDDSSDLEAMFAEDEDEVRAGQSVFRGYDINGILALAFEEGASDVHVIPYKGIFFSVLGDTMRRADLGSPEEPVIEGRTTADIQQYITTNELTQEFIVEKELASSYVVKPQQDTLSKYRSVVEKHQGKRLRVAVGNTNGNVYLVFRTITDRVPSPEQLGVEGDMLEWLSKPRGLVLINGSTGTGKSTTLASLIRQEQLRAEKKFVTIEKPVEFMYPDDGKSLVVQREVGTDTHSFEGGLTSAMREAPDVILIGEVRDRSEINELLRAAETGHLAVSTMHTKTVAGTITRMVGTFEGEDKSRVLLTLADVLQGVANQLLLKTPDGKSRFAVREVLRADDEVRDLVSAGDVEGIKKFQRRTATTMEHELARAVVGGKVTVEEAARHAEDTDFYDSCVAEIAEDSGVRLASLEMEDSDTLPRLERVRKSVVERRRKTRQEGAQEPQKAHRGARGGSGGSSSGLPTPKR